MAQRLPLRRLDRRTAEDVRYIRSNVGMDNRRVLSQEVDTEMASTFGISRRELFALAGGLTVLRPSACLSATGAEIKVAIDPDTRPDWAGPDNFMRGLRETAEVGYHYVEYFYPYVAKWENDPSALMDILAKYNMKFESITNSAPLHTNFADASTQKEQIADHVRLLKFNKACGASHLKVNCGASPGPHGNRPEVHKLMAATFTELGKRAVDMGLKFGFHAHVRSAVERQQDVDVLMDLTDPRYVHFVLDTGQVNMGGMDPVALTKKYVSRIIEYHIKDTARNTRGGKITIDPSQIDTTSEDKVGTDRVFFEAGQGGGVDFPAIKAILDQNNWSGWFTIELERSLSAKRSAVINKMYLEEVLMLKL